MAVKNIQFQQFCYWNSNSYGNGIKVDRKTLISFFIFLCVVTPFTNWLIPFSTKIIKSSWWIRWSVAT